MKTYTDKEIETEVRRIWGNDAPEKIEISQETNRVSLTLSSMYDAPGLGFAKLQALAQFFDTMNIDDAERFHSEGCETCDYGSSYGFTLVITP